MIPAPASSGTRSLAGLASYLTNPGASGLVDQYGRSLPSSEQFRSSIDYGPGVPLLPRISALNRPPRESQYTPGWNLVLTPRQEDGKTYSFAQLRLWADQCTTARIAINYRKMQLRGLEWDFIPKEEGEGEKNSVLREKYADQIKRARDFFESPNRIDGLGFSTWLGQAVEEILITDALAFFKHRDLSGNLHSLVQINGDTIKPVIDQWAHVVGYQQILYGYAATQYGYDPNAKVVIGEYDTDDAGGDLKYLVYNPRVDSIYGTSHVEEILPVVMTSIRRQLKHLAWYTDGTIPESMIEAPETWDGKAIAEYQEWLDAELAGDDKKRSNAKVVPHGANYKETKPYQFIKEEDESLNAKILAHFAVPKNVLISQTNRATAQSQKEDTIDTGQRPLVKFVCEFVTACANQDLDCPDVKLACVSDLAGNPEQRDADRADVQAGILTADEVREKRGMKALPPAPPPIMVPGFGPGQNPTEQKPSASSSGAAPKPGALPSEETPEEKAELANWKKIATQRFGKPSWSRAVEFRVSALRAERAEAVKAALINARSEADVIAAFEKAAPKKHLTAAKRKSAIDRIKRLTGKYLDFERERAQKLADELLAGNEDEEGAA